MKRNSLFRLWYLLLPVMLLTNQLHSQSVIYSSDQRSEYSIIRNYLKNVDITYSLIGDLGMRLRGFNYVDRNSMTVVSAEIPLFYAINDFVVYNDCVYFCGYDSITPIYGFFDINDVFFNNGVINYYRITQNTISSLDIIKAKKTSSGDLHMVMIGKGTSAKSSTVGLIADAWINAFGTMNFKYTLESRNEYMYNDVALTDKFAVVSARGSVNGTPNSHNIFYYYEPTVSNISYLDSWPSGVAPLWQADPTTLLSSNAISITKMEHDTFATVCNSLTSGNIVVSIYNDPMNPPVKRFELPYNDILYKIVYNTLYKTLFILPDLGHDLEYTNAPYTYTSKATATGGAKWLSIDNANNNISEIISGFDSRIQYYWQFDMSNPDNCADYTEGDNTDISILERGLTLYQRYFPETLTQERLQPHIETFILFIECQ